MDQEQLDHNLQQAGEQLADAGQGGDTIIAHLTIGEMVIPAELLNNSQELQAVLQKVFQEAGIDPNEFVVGSESQKINPETGHPQFFSLGKMFKKVFKFVKPAIGAAVGIATGNPLLGAAIGGGLGATGGGGLKGALLGGVGSYLGGGGLGTAAGVGAVGPTQGTGLLGAFTRNVPGASQAFGALKSGLGSAATSLLGSRAGAPLSGGFSGPTQGSGLFGALTRNSVGGALGGGVGNVLNGVTGAAGGGSSALNLGSQIYSGIKGNAATKKMVRSLTDANNQSLALQSRMFDQTQSNLSPFVLSGKAANSRLAALLGLDGSANMQSELESSPGYQFRLQQGQKNINQSLGARGQLFSGQALKAAQEFGQGLADQTYNDRVQQLMEQANSGQNAASGLGATGANFAANSGNLLNNQGNITAGGIQQRSNTLNQTLANILRPNSASSGQYEQVGVDAQGKPIYRRIA